MKKVLFVSVMATMFISSLAFSNPKLVKTHKGKEKDGVAVNCNYCHKINKIEKKKGEGYKAQQKKAYCSGGACHK